MAAYASGSDARGRVRTTSSRTTVRPSAVDDQVRRPDGLAGARLRQEG
ncbi:hypothetical protein [Micromonospora sp. KLBMP9576]